MPVRPPDELVRLVRDRRVIPFVGAGFSACLGLPGWSEMLQDVATDLRIEESEPNLSYEELNELADKDFLRVAEYLYIRAGRNIGPLRQSVSNALRPEKKPADSLAHVELVNLGAPQVYTTNFDDLIEKTFLELNQSVEVVALPRDVAVADSTQTQVVKYHGDLRFDETLVLTESQYWTRLDFESPMDLKFRSDLLGRSVLFMGYSFSDINIRVIWFKLMQMMRDVPEKDRLPSYIVRLDSNPVLKALFEDVGLRTIVLDPDGEARTDEEKAKLLGEFLEDLASLASVDQCIPGSGDTRMFASRELLEAAKGDVNRLAHLFGRQVPAALNNEALGVIEAHWSEEGYELLQLSADAVAWAQDLVGSSDMMTQIAVTAMLHGFSRRRLIGHPSIDWEKIWNARVDQALATRIIRDAENEIGAHERKDWLDDDLAYALDLTVRVRDGLVDDEELTERASQAIQRASTIYPSAATYEPAADGPPNPTVIVEEIIDRKESNSDEEEESPPGGSA